MNYLNGNISEMEYMIYFTFNECFHLIDNYNMGRKTLIKDLYNFYTIIEIFYESIEEKDEMFENMMDKFEEKLEYYYSRYIMGLCNYYGELFSNHIYDILYDCANEVFYKKKSYLEPYINTIDNLTDDSDNDDDNSEDNLSDNDDNSDNDCNEDNDSNEDNNDKDKCD